MKYEYYILTSTCKETGSRGLVIRKLGSLET
jgi:hypothetical protein